MSKIILAILAITFSFAAKAETPGPVIYTYQVSCAATVDDTVYTGTGCGVEAAKSALFYSCARAGEEADACQAQIRRLRIGRGCMVNHAQVCR